jgi:hypothetical protein
MLHAHKCSTCALLVTLLVVRFLPHSDQHAAILHFFALQRHSTVWNCWYQCLMLLGDGGSLLDCRWNARWTETTDSCFTNCSTQNAFCSGVAIIAVLHRRLREKRGVGMRMHTKLEHLLFRSMWETYFCMHFQNRNGRLKPLQSFWCTLYNWCNPELYLICHVPS